MKYIPLLLCVLVMACIKNPGGPNEPPTWQQCSTLSSDQGHYDIFFVDENEGWLIKGRGNIYHSSNSGTSWELQHSWDRGLRFIHFIDNKYGWATGQLGTFYTIDGGMNWTYYGIEGGMPHFLPVYDKIVFIDRKNILIFSCTLLSNYIGARRLAFDSDSTKFTGIASYTFPEYLSVIANKNYKIWVTDVKQNIHISTDGGLNWTSHDVSASGCGDVSDIRDIYIQDETHGWFCSNTSVYQSADGGATWNCLAELPDSSLNRISFAGNEGWVMAEHAIYYSSNGGETWQEQLTIEGEQKLTSMSFVDNTNGWALSDSGSVYRYGIENF